MLTKRRVWGAMYLLSIPIFALIYMHPSFEFYHGTLPLERPLEVLKNDIESDISNEITHYIDTQLGGYAKDQETKIIVSSLEYEESELDFVAFFHSEEVGSVSAPQHGLLDCRTAGLGGQTFSQGEFVDIVEIHCVKTPNQQLPLNFGYEGGRGGRVGLVEGPIRVFKELYPDRDAPLLRKIEQYSLGMRGLDDSEKARDRFVRMFYLSAVTITTLGYGDITPTNTFARLLVSIQSIFGVVLIGLFISSFPTTTDN